MVGGLLRDLGAVFVDEPESAARAAARALALGASVVWAASVPVPAVDVPVVAVDVRRADGPSADDDAGALATYVRTAARPRTTLVIAPRLVS